jgi:hypothetical protein
LPHITEWDKKYRDKGLVIIGVHSPEFEFEKDLGNIKNATVQYGIHYPVASDANLDTWAAFNNQYWPAHYLINKDGQVVYTHFGEGNYDITENNIRFLLGLTGEAKDDTAAPEFSDNQTPETYLGYGRATRFDGTAVHDKLHDYSSAGEPAQDAWTLSGAWNIQADHIVSGGADAALQFHVNAKKVFLVMGTSNGKPADVTVQVAGQADKTVHVTGHELYTLAELPQAQSVIVKLTAARKGVELYAFTFGG